MLIYDNVTVIYFCRLNRFLMVKLEVEVLFESEN